MPNSNSSLRIALIAGTLGRAGAEKQLVYMARALRGAGADVRVYCVTQGEYYESRLRNDGLEVRWFGQSSHPLLRLSALTADLRKFRPNIVQSTHFFTNLYSGLAGRFCRALSIGAIRNETRYELDDNGRWGRLLLSTPSMLIANSQFAVDGAIAVGVEPRRIRYLPNAIDLCEFDRCSKCETPPDRRRPTKVIAVGRLVRAKRFDRFLDALALARRSVPDLSGILVGGGPEQSALEHQRDELGLHDHVELLGARDDVPAQLSQSDVLALSSDHEGFPNVILEAMSASLPVVATPAGDAGRVVKDGETGFIVPFDAPEEMAERLVRLAGDRELRSRFGEAGRRRVQASYSYESLAGNLLNLYRGMAEGQLGLLRTLELAR